MNERWRERKETWCSETVRESELCDGHTLLAGAGRGVEGAAEMTGRDDSVVMKRGALLEFMRLVAAAGWALGPHCPLAESARCR